jgi:hypothetical protein
MPNAVPSTFDYRDGCGWFKKSDNSGPYAINSNGKAVLLGGGADYETVAASQTGQVLGATGAVGDYIDKLVCVVSTAATSQVTLIDGATSIVVLPNNVGAGVGTYTIPLGLQSVSGAWSITTAAGVAVVAVGNFT